MDEYIMAEMSYPYLVKRHHACVHQEIPIIFTRDPGVRFDRGRAYVGYPLEPFGSDGKVTMQCRQFLIELQVRGKLLPLIVFGKKDSIFIDMESNLGGIQDYHGTLFIRTRGFYNEKERTIVNEHIVDGRQAAVVIRRTSYGSYILFLRYKDNAEEQWIMEGNLQSVGEAAGEILDRVVVAEEEKPIFRLYRGNLTADGCPVLKVFGTDSGKRWFVTLREDLRDVTPPESDPDVEDGGSITQYFGIIREGDREIWDFWMDEEIGPLLQNGEAKEYRVDELGFLDLATIDAVYLE